MTPLLFQGVVPPPSHAPRRGPNAVVCSGAKPVVSPHCVKAMLLDSSRHPCRGGGSYGVPARSDAIGTHYRIAAAIHLFARAQERTQPSERPGEFGVVSTPNVRHTPARQYTPRTERGKADPLEEEGPGVTGPASPLPALSSAGLPAVVPGRLCPRSSLHPGAASVRVSGRPSG